MSLSIGAEKAIEIGNGKILKGNSMEKWDSYRRMDIVIRL